MLDAVVTISSRPSLVASADRMAALSDFGAARGEHDLVVECRAEQRLQLPARQFHRLRDFAPKACADDAFPNWSEKYGNIAATTAGSVRVVALLSR